MTVHNKPPPYRSSSPRSERTETRREWHYDRGSDRPRSLRELVDQFKHRRYENGWEQRPVMRDHRHLDGQYRAERRPIEQYTGYTGPAAAQPYQPAPSAPYQPVSSNLPGMNLGGVGDPGFTAPTYGPQAPQAIDPGFSVQGARDVSAANALKELAQLPAPISGDQMMNAINKGVGDNDGRSTTTELQLFKDFAQKYADKLSPEAHTCVGIYEKYAKAAGDGGIPQSKFDKMLGEMSRVKDASMYHALGALSSQKGPVTGAQMGDALIRGLSDHDGKGNTTELDQVKQWAAENASKLSPAAKMAVRAYVQMAEASVKTGAPGLTAAEMGTLRRKLQGAALADDLQ